MVAANIPIEDRRWEQKALGSHQALYIKTIQKLRSKGTLLRVLTNFFVIKEIPTVKKKIQKYHLMDSLIEEVHCLPMSSLVNENLDFCGPNPTEYEKLNPSRAHSLTVGNQ